MEATFIGVNCYKAKYMDYINTPVVVIVILLGLALIVFVTVRNQKDKKGLNPDSQEAVEEERTDAEHDRDKL